MGVIHRRQEFFGDYRMQSQIQTSKPLRQSKICLAVATLLAAMSMPAQANDVVESETTTWSDERTGVVNKMNERLANMAAELETKFKSADELHSLRMVRSYIHSNTNDISDKAEYEAALGEMVEKINGVISELNDNEGSGLEHSWERDLKVGDLENVKTEIQRVLTANPEGHTNARAQLRDFLNDDAAFLARREAALDLYAEITAFSARIKALDNVDEATFKVIANTKELVVPAQSGADAVPTWRDGNLLNAYSEEGYAEGNLQINKETVLEITKRSGAGSDVMIGEEEEVRDVGAIRVAKDVSHSIGIINGDLNIHQSIGGEGELAVVVGNGGELKFVAGGKGIDPAAKHVLLIVGSGASAEDVAEGAFGKAGKIDEDPGVIRFEAGTSAQNAEIAVATRGRLQFEEGSNAGASTIMVNGGTVHFDEAHAGSASIWNAGKLVVDDSAMGTSSVVNHAKGRFFATDVQLESMRLKNRGKTKIFDAVGGNASISNEGRGHIEIIETQLENAKIDNASTMFIERSSGDNATILNGRGAVLTFSDTALESLRIENRGTVIAKENTTANNARIRMDGGVFDVSRIESSEGEDYLAAEITIGSLSGQGDLIADETRVTLGALNQDDVFDGRVLASKESPHDIKTRLRGKSKRHAEKSDLLTNHPGVDLTKIGTGNLTLTADQSDVTSMTIAAGTLTAAHANALGAGYVDIGENGTVVLTQNVSGVDLIENAGTLNLGTNKLSVESYLSEAGAKIQSRVEKVEGNLVGGKIHVSNEGDFTNTTVGVDVAPDIELSEIVGHFEVVQAEGDAKVSGGEVTVGSITGGKKPEPVITDPEDPNVPPEDPTVKPITPTIEPGTDTGTKITDKNIVNFLAADGGYTANERAVLASVDGVTVGELTSGAVGGKVLSAMALQTAGSDEQRKSARMLSGESLVNNAVAAQAAATSFQRGMQTRMIAGGAMFDDKATTGAMAADNGIAGWASFNGGTASQRGDGMSFDVKGLDGAIGVDKRVNQNTLVGASVGFGNQESKAKGLPGESKVNSVSVGLYGSHLTDSNWFVNGGASYTNHSVKTDRTVAARNASARLTGKTSGQTFGMFGEVGKRFEVSGMNIDPSVGVRVASTRLNAFDETNRDGEGNDGLKVGSQSQTSTRGVLGVRLWSEVASVAGGKIAPSLRLSYEHEFGNTQSSLTSAIYGASNHFTVKGPKLGKDIFTADLGVDMQLKKQLEVRVGGNVSVRKGESALGGGISAKYRF
ncbi:autotransporter outer membrane beta-barrel domain-containing protein [Pandoraea fibrosis]|nr:autotransporter outer membrane beta-barrel domain-containing protein [Pandoraea fibrosis]